MTAGAHPGRDEHYDRVAVLLHWSMAACLTAEIFGGFLMQAFTPPGSVGRAAAINLHKSFGLFLGLLAVARLLWRLGHPRPPWPTAMSAARRFAATTVHAMMYACMLIAPIAGYIASNHSRYGVSFFGIRISPWGPDTPAVYKLFNSIHDVAAWTLVVLIGVHCLAALSHAIRKDAVTQRMKLLRGA